MSDYKPPPESDPPESEPTDSEPPESESSGDEQSAPDQPTETPSWLVPEDDSNISKQGLLGSRMIIMAASVLAVVLFGATIWYFYTLSDRAEPGEAPLIEAPDGPDKVEPEDRGGLEVPDQDKLVFDRVSGDETEIEDVLTDAPEQPLDRPEAEDATATPTAADEPDDAAPAEEEVEAAPAAGATTEPREAAVDGAGAYWVQMASFGQESAAGTAWTRIEQRHSMLLRGLGPDIERAELDDGRIFYRLRTGPFPGRASADGLCRSLKAAGQDCLVISP